MLVVTLRLSRGTLFKFFLQHSTTLSRSLLHEAARAAPRGHWVHFLLHKVPLKKKNHQDICALHLRYLVVVLLVALSRCHYTPFAQLAQ